MTRLPRTTRDDRILILVSLIVLAFLLRWFLLDRVPPGWRDDELINSLVISQKVLDGDLAVYYPDASGHEALYHALNAIFLGLFGPGMAGIRLLSAVLGTLTVPLTYLVGRKLYNGAVGLAAALSIAVSFWSLMYSRIGLRHISLPVLALTAFYFFWRGLAAGKQPTTNNQQPITNYLLAAIFTALGFYTYFASRGVPLILLAFMGYIWLVDREQFRRHWRGWAAMLGVMALLAIPLVVTLGRQPGSEARVAELAVPLVEARVGNFEPLLIHIGDTLSMFHSTGDGEWLYNIPDRPIFGPVGAIFFWSGVAIALWYALKPVVSSVRYQVSCITHHASPANRQSSIINYQLSLAAAFLLLWWLAGISPAFISVPPASLGHTILAQPAVFLLAALPVGWLVAGGWRLGGRILPLSNLQSPIAWIMGVILLVSIAARDLPDYFVNWPERGMVRFLYRADIQDVADYLNTNTIHDVGISGLLAGPWDKIALEIGLADGVTVNARWFNPERAILLHPTVSFTGYPDVAAAYANWMEPVVHPKWGEVTAGGYRLTQVVRKLDLAEPVCFVNGLCWVTAVYHPDTQILELGWQVGRELDLPDMPLISNPPPPGVYAGPRLYIFGQLWDADDNFLTGDDGLWVDPATLQPGDLFVQQHRFQLADVSGVATAVFGLYDPMTGERILTEDGRDHLRLEIGD